MLQRKHIILIAALGRFAYCVEASEWRLSSAEAYDEWRVIAMRDVTTASATTAWHRVLQEHGAGRSFVRLALASSERAVDAQYLSKPSVHFGPDKLRLLRADLGASPGTILEFLRIGGLAVRRDSRSRNPQLVSGATTLFRQLYQGLPLRVQHVALRRNEGLNARRGRPEFQVVVFALTEESDRKRLERLTRELARDLKIRDVRFELDKADHFALLPEYPLLNLFSLNLAIPTFDEMAGRLVCECLDNLSSCTKGNN